MKKKLILAAVLVLAVVTASFATTKAMDIVAQLNPEIQVSLNGKVLDLKSLDGQKVNVMVYNGTTYLPVRALSDALGLQVGWDHMTKTVILNSGNQGTNNQGTDANSGATQTASSAKTNVGDIVFQNEKLVVRYAGIDTDHDDDEAEVKFVVENLTKEKYVLTVADTRLDAKKVPSRLHDAEDIDRLEKEDVEIEFRKSELKKAGVMEPGVLEFKFKLNHKTASFETSVIKVNF